MNKHLLQATTRFSNRDYLLRGRYKESAILPVPKNDTNEKAAINSILEHPMDPQTHGSYKALILHPKWKLRRKEILHRDRHCCVNCGHTNELQVHHRQYHFILALKQYKTPWDYQDHLLITLCQKCHSQGHSKFRVPIIKM
jgi:hypothetical protein